MMSELTKYREEINDYLDIRVLSHDNLLEAFEKIATASKALKRENMKLQSAISLATANLHMGLYKT